MSTVLYRNPKGYEVTNFSNSQADLLRFCPHKYILARHLGLAQARVDPNLHFGNCAEEAIRMYHQSGLSPAQMFSELWAAAVREHGSSVTWEGWKTPESMDEAGRNLMRAYSNSYRRLGIRNPTFFTFRDRGQFTRDIGVNLQSVPDCIDDPEPHPHWGDGPRVIDIKCPESAPQMKYEGMVSLDEQLRTYSYTTGLRRVALLLLIKGNPGAELKAGSIRTYLGASKELLGRQVKIVEATKKSGVRISVNGTPESTSLSVDVAEVPNVRIFFAEGAVSVTEAEATAAGLLSEALMQSRRWEEYAMAEATLRSQESSLSYAEYSSRRRALLRLHFPQRPGLRFPNDRCSWCEMLGECLDRPDISAERLVRIDEKWLEDL